MKVLVVKDSVIYQGSIYKTDSSFELDDVIAKELIKNGYVVAYGNDAKSDVAESVKEDSQEEQKEEKTLTATFDKEQLEDMKYQDLKKLASDMGLDASGKKEEIIERILSTSVEVDEDSIVDEDEAESDEAPNTSMPE